MPACRSHITLPFWPCLPKVRQLDIGKIAMLADEMVQEDARFVPVARDAALRELYTSTQHSLGDDEIERSQLSKALLSHVRRFYAGYFDPGSPSTLLPSALAGLTELARSMHEQTTHHRCG
jgi:hypothetical protein